MHRLLVPRLRKYNTYGTHTVEEWQELKRTYGYACGMCWKKEPDIALTIDHKIPLSQGGTNSIDNIQPLCKSCNSKKGRKTWFSSHPLISNHIT